MSERVRLVSEKEGKLEDKMKILLIFMLKRWWRKYNKNDEKKNYILKSGTKGERGRTERCLIMLSFNFIYSFPHSCYFFRINCIFVVGRYPYTCIVYKFVYNSGNHYRVWEWSEWKNNNKANNKTKKRMNNTIN